MDIVQATELLAGVTLLLVIGQAVLAAVAFMQYRAAKTLATDQRRTTEVLEDQARALQSTAAASQALADESLAARRAAVPLSLVILPHEPTPGVLSVAVERSGGRGVVIRHVEILAGLGADQLLLHTETFANLYLGGGTERFYIRQPFNPTGRDVLVLRITGQPEGGIEQAQDTLYRIPPNGPPTRLSRDAEAAEAIFGR
jgi:hypothetical protein